jgi:hypothetical protein
MLISVVGTGQNKLLPVKESMGGCCSIVTLFFGKKYLTKPTGVLEHCCEGKTNWWFSLFRGFSF